MRIYIFFWFALFCDCAMAACSVGAFFAHQYIVTGVGVFFWVICTIILYWVGRIIYP